MPLYYTLKNCEYIKFCVMYILPKEKCFKLFKKSMRGTAQPPTCISISIWPDSNISNP